MKKILAILLVFVMMISLVACGAKSDTSGNKSTAASDEEIVLEIWLQNGNVGEASLPEDEWWITNAIAEFEDANPNIKIDLTVPSGQVELIQTYKAACVAGTAPDIVNLWGGTNMFPLKDLVLDPTEYLTEDSKNIPTWNECYMNFDSNDKLLGIPLAEPGINVCTFFYNKNIFADAGIDLEVNPIKTVDDFEAVLKQLKDAGYQPISCDDEGYGVMFCCLGLWWANASGSATMYSNSIGETKFADDEAFVGILTKANEWYEAGYINQDYATCTESVSRFMQGECAIHGCGTWHVQDIAAAMGAENVGRLPMGAWSANDKFTYDSMGGNGQIMAISATCEHPAEAVKFVEFLNSKDQIEKAQKQELVLPGRSDVEYPETGGLFDDVIEAVGNCVFYYDNTMRADIITEFYRLWPLVVTGITSVDEAVSALDAMAASGG